VLKKDRGISSKRAARAALRVRNVSAKNPVALGDRARGGATEKG
jgi:hypothetical protein